MGGETCLRCEGSLERGFLMDGGQGGTGATNWVRGKLKRGPFGGAKLWGKPKAEISAMRCTRCGRIELYAGEPS